jgi:hypothetical protein
MVETFTSIDSSLRRLGDKYEVSNRSLILNPMPLLRAICTIAVIALRAIAASGKAGGPRSIPAWAMVSG